MTKMIICYECNGLSRPGVKHNCPERMARDELIDLTESIKQPKVDKTLIGPAGENLVLARLLSRGHLASAAPRGVRKVDVIVNLIDGGNPKLIQVKTTMYSPDSGWPLSDKHEEIVDEDLFYCFVSFADGMGEVYVIPAAVVAEAIKTDHQIWLDQPGKDGNPHSTENRFRQIRSQMNGKPDGWLWPYREAWGQLS